MTVDTRLAALVVAVVTVFFLVAQADSRGLRGGGYSRHGIASGGSISARTADRPASRNTAQAERERDQGDRQDHVDERQQDRQDFAEDRQEDREDFAEDRQEDREDLIDEHDDDWDDRHDDWDDDDGELLAGAIVGATVVGVAAAATRPESTTTYVTTLPCEATAVAVEGVSYYKCGDDWFTRAYAGSEVTYLSVPAPPGF
jgi:hypothetical protein